MPAPVPVTFCLGLWQLARSAGAGDSAAILAPRVAGERKRHLGEAHTRGLVVVPDLDAVIRMDALGVGKPDIVLSEAVLIRHQLEPFFGHP